MDSEILISAQICGNQTIHSQTTNGPKKKIKGEIKKYLEISKNENTAYYNS
jgi:hypothetical protein